MKFIAAIIVLAIAYFLLTIIGSLFVGVIGFLIDHFLVAFIGLAILIFLFDKK